MCHLHLALKIEPFVRYSIIFSNSNFLVSRASKVSFLSFSSMLLDSIKHCKVLISLSRFSSRRDVFAFFIAEYFKECSLIFELVYQLCVDEGNGTP